MFTDKKKTLLVGAAMFAGMVFSGGAVAQAAAFSPAGPIEINGYVSVDNTGKGGDYVDFNCKVKGYGFISAANPNQLLIRYIQAFNHGVGEVPRGCNAVATGNYNWVVTINPPPGAGNIPVHTSTGVTVTGVAFQAPGNPGCGVTAGGVFQGTTTTTGGGGTVTWEQENPAATVPVPLPGVMFDAAYSRLVFANAEMVDTASPGNCRISGVLKFSRPDAVMAN